MFQVKDLIFKYPNNKDNTIKKISFKIDEGEIFGLLGPSGVGKSTTQKILTKLLTAYSGTVLFKGKDLKSCKKEFYEEIGVGFEIPVHFSKLTAEENINFFKKLYKENADTDELLKQVGLYEDKDKMVSEFSKGMKTRLNFIRALINKPKILFLDEPTNGLDPKNARIIKDIIREFKQNGGTVLLTTHLMNDVDELCDRVAFMADGKITEIDSPKNLKIKHGKKEVDVEFLENKQLMKQSFQLKTLGNDELFIDTIKTKDIVTIHSKETTLDDIFIKVTGVKNDE